MIYQCEFDIEGYLISQVMIRENGKPESENETDSYIPDMLTDDRRSQYRRELNADYGKTITQEDGMGNVLAYTDNRKWLLVKCEPKPWSPEVQKAQRKRTAMDVFHAEYPEEVERELIHKQLETLAETLPEYKAMRDRWRAIQKEHEVEKS